MGKWNHIFDNSRGGREVHPLELFGPLCDRCTNSLATDSWNGDSVCSSCAYTLRQAHGDES